MKIRNGFVSNSSSSSFVILGTIVNIKNIDENDLKSKEYSYLADTGINYEANMYAEISSKKMLNLLKRANDGEFGVDFMGRTVFKAYAYAYGDGSEISIKKEKLPEVFQLFTDIADQGSPMDNPKDLEAMFKGEY